MQNFPPFDCARVIQPVMFKRDEREKQGIEQHRRRKEPRRVIDDDFDNYAPWQQRAKREKRAAVRQQNGHERARTSMALDKSGSK